MTRWDSWTAAEDAALVAGCRAGDSLQQLTGRLDGLGPVTRTANSIQTRIGTLNKTRAEKLHIARPPIDYALVAQKCRERALEALAQRRAAKAILAPADGWPPFGVALFADHPQAETESWVTRLAPPAAAPRLTYAALP